MPRKARTIEVQCRGCKIKFETRDLKVKTRQYHDKECLLKNAGNRAICVDRIVYKKKNKKNPFDWPLLPGTFETCDPLELDHNEPRWIDDLIITPRRLPQ